jgi:hypothetical protein
MGGILLSREEKMGTVLWLFKDEEMSREEKIGTVPWLY